MTGCRSGIMELAKKKNPRIIRSHCIIHRQALASQTLLEPLSVTLNLAIKIVNHIKSSALNTRLFRTLCQELNSDQETLLFHTEVRWLFKGNMLARLFNLKSEVEILLLTSKQEDLHRRFTDDKNIFYLAYLSDFFETLNVLNPKLQGRKNLLNTYDAIKGVIEKISLWQRRLYSSKPNISSFPKLNDLLNDIQTLPLHLVSDLKDVISRHLEELKNQIRKYFSDVSSKNWEFKLTRDPFHIDVEILQEQAIDLKCNSQAKSDFANMDLEEFCLIYFPVYPEVALVSAMLLVQFSSTYLCESSFSALAYIK
ncbi:protein FAM200A-like [Diabrotica undecimpunctata]|uniref:protein FAM200A-like n=1 Tax=Diabrotica undecimpunctata TaxID=50387 RepID=UPI003B636BF6